MTKSEFVDQVASRASLDKKQASDAVDAVLETIQEALERGSDVTFSGFGKFSVAERGARVDALPRPTLGDAELAEARKRDIAAALEGLLDRLQDRVHGITGLLLVEARAAGDLIDEL